MKTSITLIIALFGFILLSAQNGQISGEISLTHSAGPGAGAELVLKGTSLGAVSADDGKYVIDGISRGNYNLEISFPGIPEKKIINLNVDSNQKIILNFEFCYTQNVKKKCPACTKSSNAVKIMYGTPSEKELKRIEKGDAKLLPFEHSNCAPTYYCKKCKLEF